MRPPVEKQDVPRAQVSDGGAFIPLAVLGSHVVVAVPEGTHTHPNWHSGEEPAPRVRSGKHMPSLASPPVAWQGPP
jgi:hypothetical protein